MDTQTPESPIVKFLRSKIAIPVGMALALVLGIFLMYQGVDKGCCGLGALIIAVLMFFIVKLFNGKSTKLLVCYGVIFFVVATLVGAFAFSPAYINENKNYDNFDSSNFSNLEIVYDNDSTVTVSITYTGEGTTVFTEFRPLAWVCYKSCNYYTGDDYKHSLTETSAESHRYTGTFSIENGKAYSFDFYSNNAEGNMQESSTWRFFTSNGFDQSMFCLQWNAYWVVIPSIIFVLIAFITLFLRNRLEKKRKEMIAEGRLYPEGYGRCKECGSIVLPGEVSCRKCGAYIDVPENLRVKKADSFQCSECGAEVPGDANVCPKCGAKFDDETETVIVEQNQQNNAQNTADSFQCSDCGATVPGNATICPNCGAKFDEDENESRKCPICGTSVPDYANNCHKCGAKLNQKR